MSDLQGTIMDRAAEKLLSEIETIKGEKGGGNQKVQARQLAVAVGKMLVNFCYQSEDFAAAVFERDAKLFPWALEIVAKNWTTGLSDVAAYTEAVKHYMPGATVRATFRVDAPRETDDDLLDLNLGTDAPEHTAIILELPDVEGEV